MLICGLSTCKIQVDHTVQVMVCTFGTAVLIFYLWTAVPIFGQCKHKISTASAVVGTDVVCIIGTAVLIFGQCKHKISTALPLLIFGARKCASAIFYAFCMFVLLEIVVFFGPTHPPPTLICNVYFGRSRAPKKCWRVLKEGGIGSLSWINSIFNPSHWSRK